MRELRSRSMWIFGTGAELPHNNVYFITLLVSYLKEKKLPFHFLSKVAIVCVLCLILLPASLQAQSDRSRHTFYSIQDGISNYWVNCLFQDREGFMWIGTQDGLNRYDGYAFKQYLYHSDTDSSNIRNCVWAIAEDEEGNLWVGTGGGLTVAIEKGNPSLISSTTRRIRKASAPTV